MKYTSSKKKPEVGMELSLTISLRPELGSEESVNSLLAFLDIADVVASDMKVNDPARRRGRFSVLDAGRLTGNP